MVEEFMLLANVSVAKKIYDEFSQCAVLRRHPSPPYSNFDPMLAVCKAYVRRSCEHADHVTSLLFLIGLLLVDQPIRLLLGTRWFNFYVILLR